jgi:hypothetical protein
MEINMKSFFKFAGAGLFLMSAPLLRADSVLFTLTDSDHVISFSLPSQATPDQSGEDFENIPFFFVNNVAVTVDGTTTNQGVVFSDSGFQHIAFGNAWFVTPEDQVIANNTFAGFFEEEQEIFSGPVGNPTFIPGTAHGFDFEPAGKMNSRARLISKRLRKLLSLAASYCLAAAFWDSLEWCAAGGYFVLRYWTER